MTRKNVTQKGLYKGQKTYKTSNITPAKKTFATVYATTENGTQSALVAYPHLTTKSAADKASKLLKNEEIINHIEYQKEKLEKLATKAVKRVETLIQSKNEMVATTNAWKTIEQVQGRATQKTLSINAHASLEDAIALLK